MAVQLRISKELLSRMDPVPIPCEGKRPYHGNRQIKDQFRLDSGLWINIHGPGGKIIKAIVVCSYKESGVLKLDYQYSDGGETPYDGTILLADYSVVRNDKREWEPTNWLEKA